MRLVTVLICILAFSYVSGQNSSFLSFGLSEQEVAENLGHYDRPLGELKRGPQLLTYQFTDGRWLSYHFLGDQLYQIEDTQIFKNKDKSKEAIEACLFYISLGRKPIEMDAASNTTHYAKVLDDRIMELIIFQDRRNNTTQVTMRVTSRHHGPRTETEQMALLIKES